jgi:hypothetical protein
MTVARSHVQRRASALPGARAVSARPPRAARSAPRSRGRAAVDLKPDSACRAPHPERSPRPPKAPSVPRAAPRRAAERGRAKGGAVEGGSGDAERGGRRAARTESLASRSARAAISRSMSATLPSLAASWSSVRGIAPRRAAPRTLCADRFATPPPPFARARSCARPTLAATQLPRAPARACSRPSDPTARSRDLTPRIPGPLRYRACACAHTYPPAPLFAPVPCPARRRWEMFVRGLLSRLFRKFSG